MPRKPDQCLSPSLSRRLRPRPQCKQRSAVWLLAASQPSQTQTDANFFDLFFMMSDLSGSTAAISHKSNVHASPIRRQRVL
jgi:hypothetical protein